MILLLRGTGTTGFEMQRSNTPTDPLGDSIQVLLQAGLDHYGRGDVDSAVRCWTEVLELNPNQEQARDYLDAAGVSENSPNAEVIDIDSLRERAGLSSDRPRRTLSQDPGPLLLPGGQPSPELERMLKQRRYDDALALLYAARAKHPQDASISRSIRLLRERLILSYAERLTTLDHVPTVAADFDRSRLSSEQRQVLSFVDGISTFGDIAAANASGQLLTLRVLSDLQDAGAFNVESPGSSRRPSSRPMEEPSVRPTGPVAKSRPAALDAPDEAYEALFRRATEAYLRREFEQALQLFQLCSERRPADNRPRHNLTALKRRLGRAQ